jgi:hypothetical protein
LALFLFFSSFLSQNMCNGYTTACAAHAHAATRIPANVAKWISGKQIVVGFPVNFVEFSIRAHLVGARMRRRGGLPCRSVTWEATNAAAGARRGRNGEQQHGGTSGLSDADERCADEEPRQLPAMTSERCADERCADLGATIASVAGHCFFFVNFKNQMENESVFVSAKITAGKVIGK